MGRAPCCDKANVKKGPWSPEEDTLLRDYLHKHGTGGNWISLPQKAGLRRCGKSCRLRWLNYLRPNIKHGEFSDEEDRIICSFFASIGSRWSIIAAQLPGRTDNDIKNYWNTKLKKKFMAMMMMNYSTSSSSSSSSSQIRAPNHLKNNYQSPPNLLDQSPSPPPPYNNTTQSYNSFPIPSPIQSQEVEGSVLMFGGSSSSSNDVYGGVNEGLEEIKQLISTNNVCNNDNNNNDFNFLVDHENNNKTEEQVMFYYYYYY